MHVSNMLLILYFLLHLFHSLLVFHSQLFQKTFSSIWRRLKGFSVLLLDICEYDWRDFYLIIFFFGVDIRKTNLIRIQLFYNLVWNSVHFLSLKSSISTISYPFLDLLFFPQELLIALLLELFEFSNRFLYVMLQRQYLFFLLVQLLLALLVHFLYQFCSYLMFG